jgi:amino acid adenylation domain-containing protein
MKTESFAYAPIDATTLVGLLRQRTADQPDFTIFSYLTDGETKEERFTYVELDRKARAIAALLQGHARKGDRALLLYPPGLDYIAGFFGCLYAGVVAVPAYPPDPARIQRSLPRLQAIVDDAQAKLALSTSSIATLIKALKYQDQAARFLEKIPILGKAAERLAPGQQGFLRLKSLRNLSWLATDGLDAGRAENWIDPGIKPEDLAFLQYTSGSTGNPKGVMVTHGNLLHNLSIIRTGFGLTPGWAGVGWLPMYHDMGLIGCMLSPLYTGFPILLMSPLAFLQWPLRWLKAISQQKGHPVASGGPNFAYDLCIRKVTEEQKALLDLSNWRVAFSGAEPVRGETLERFARTFASCGFRREAFYPCYGLAEGTLMVSGGLSSDLPVTAYVSNESLLRGRAVAVSDDDPDAHAFVGCGKALGGQTIRIVNPETKICCAPDEVGEIWVKGPSIAHGYWNRATASQETFRAFTKDDMEGPFLRTGDLGFLCDGELFITGRMKDLIIIRGRNHYPQDLELTVEKSHPALRPGCGAAFSVDQDGDERLVIVHEVRPRKTLDLDDVIGAVRRLLSEEHDLQAYAVALIKPRTIPKTSSGKIQRTAAKRSYLEGSLEILRELRAGDMPRAKTPERLPSGEDKQYLLTREQLNAVPLEQRSALLEDHLRDQIARVLRIAPVRIDSRVAITNLGLDSIMAIDLKDRIETSLNVHLPIATLVEGPSLRKLAEHLSERMEEAPKPAPSPAVSGHASGEFPLSEGQKAMWFQHQLAPQSIFNPAYAARIRASLDIERLRESFQKVVDRHAMLRTTIHQQHGEVFQRVHPAVEVSFEQQDVSSLSPQDLRQRIDNVAHQHFDLETGPLFRVHLFSTAADDHVLLMAVHHIVSDMWSHVIITDEVSAIYSAKQGERPSPDVPMAYSEYVRRQDEMLQGPRGLALWDYWKEKLGGLPPALDLSIAGPRPPIQTFAAGTRSLSLGAQVTERLKAVANEHGATLFMTLLAAFKVLLHRYSGQSDLVVGTPMAGRIDADFARTVGYFVNPVAIRTRLDRDGTFSQYLGQVRHSVTEALDHQEYPINMLVQKLQPLRDPSRTPIFQTMFVFQRAHLQDHQGLSGFALGSAGEHVELAGLPLDSVPIEEQNAPFDITLMMAEGSGGLGISLTYSSGLFDADGSASLLESFHTLLEQIAGDPNARISRMELIPAQERKRLVQDLNQTCTPLPAARSVHDWFVQQVQKTPEAAAVIFREQTLSYRDLDAKSNQLARYLLGLGVKPEQPVGLCVERSMEMVIGMLAILKAGGAYVPMDPGYPTLRLQAMVEDASISILITQNSLAERFAGCQIEILRADSDWPAIATEDRHEPIAPVSPDNLAYVIYTSGSTGKPKGVMQTHRSLANLAQAQIRDFAISNRSRVMQFASMSFDASVSEIFTSLLSGATLCLVDREALLLGSGLIDLLREKAITTVTLPPSVLQVLQDAALPDLRTLVSAGEACTAAIAQRWSKDRQFINAYGPTETTVCASSYHFEQNGDGTPVPIGRPIDNVRLYILDQQVNLLPVGVPGELYIGGIGLARGYLGGPDITAEKFIPDPFGAVAGARMYRTGDLGRHLFNGNIEFLGRIDSQVKIRGFRVEMEEIEHALALYPAISETVVLAKGNAVDTRLVAYVVLKNGHTVTIGDLHEWLRQTLPEYMIPSGFEILEQLPRLPGGKHDRRALALLKGERLGHKDEFVPLQNDVEFSLAALWQEALGIEKVGREDNFFDLGGHSLLAVKMHGKLQEKFNRTFPMVELFRYPTIASLARFLSTDAGSDSIVSSSQSRAELQKQAFRRQRVLRRVSAGSSTSISEDIGK